MTDKEVIEWLKAISATQKNSLHENSLAERKEALHIAIQAIGKQQAKKVRNRKLRIFNETPYSVQGDCPSCGWEGMLSMNTNYCNACGQKLDWRLEELEQSEEE